jgi:hypothetical protein
MNALYIVAVFTMLAGIYTAIGGQIPAVFTYEPKTAIPDERNDFGRADILGRTAMLYHQEAFRVLARDPSIMTITPGDLAAWAAAAVPAGASGWTPSFLFDAAAGVLYTYGNDPLGLSGSASIASRMAAASGDAVGIGIITGGSFVPVNGLFPQSLSTVPAGIPDGSFLKVSRVRTP